jgi:hypothetical protein
VQIDVAKRRKVKHPLRNDAAVTDHDDGVGLESGELRAEGVILLDGFRLCDGQAQLQRAPLDRGRNKFEAATFGTVRLRDYATDVESSVDQFVERGHGEARRAAENEIEG